jgi:RNA recognition motif-containing protein
MNKKLYVGNLLYEATEDNLRDLFSQAGEVTAVQVIRFADSGRSKGFGFVEMVDEESASKAIEMFHDQDFMGRKLIVNEARPMRPAGERGNDRRGGFRGGNRRFGGNRGGGFRGGNRNDGYRSNQEENNNMDMNSDMSDIDMNLE